MSPRLKSEDMMAVSHAAKGEFMGNDIHGVQSLGTLGEWRCVR